MWGAVCVVQAVSFQVVVTGGVNGALAPLFSEIGAHLTPPATKLMPSTKSMLERIDPSSDVATTW